MLPTPAKAVVTGVTSGIGLAITTRLTELGCVVYGLARDHARLEDLSTQLRAGTLHPVTADLNDPDAVTAALETITRDAAPFDLLVNNAAHCLYHPPATLPARPWRELVETNLLSAIALTHGLLPRMRRGSHIVNISSAVARFLPDAGYAPYALTKAALDHYTRALTLDLRDTGIKATLIAPGLVDTPLYDKTEGFAEHRTRLAGKIPRWLSPEDIADCVLWLTTTPEHMHVAELVLLPTGQGR